MVKRRLSARLETKIDFTFLIRSQACYPLGQRSSSCSQTIDSATLNTFFTIDSICTSAALYERGQEVMGETPMTRWTRGLKAVAIRVPISAALPRRKAPGFNNAGVISPPRSWAAGSIHHESEITPALLKQGACRLEAMDDETFQRHRRLV